MNIYKKLSNVQTELKAPKNQFNGFGKYKYRSCEDILEAVKPLLAKNKLTMIISDEIEHIGERFYIKATIELFDVETGETIITSKLAREEETKKGMDASQLTGSTSSYATKYALNGLFLIDDTKDADATNNHGNDQKNENKSDNKSDNKNDKQQQKKETKKITIDTYLEAIRKYEKEYQTEIKDYLVDKALTEIEDLNFEQAKELAIQIKEKVKGGK